MRIAGDCRIARDLRDSYFPLFLRVRQSRNCSCEKHQADGYREAQANQHCRAPTNFASRARVISSFSGSGANGINNPVCDARGLTGSALIVTVIIGAVGG